MTRRTASGRLAGILAATAALIATGFVSIGFYASYGGIVIAGAIAIFAGSTAGAAVDRRRAHNHAGIVAFYVVALGAAYVLFAQAFASSMPPAARGGPAVYPLPRGGPGVYPPSVSDGSPVTYPPQQLDLHSAVHGVQPGAAATIYEGARLIAGDGSAPVEDSAFVVDGDRITAVGKKGSLQAPPNARRVDLSGKTVMPALVDAHVHLGYRRGTTFTASNYTRENLLDELDRFAYFGVAAVLEAGTGRGDLPFQVRADARTSTRYLTAGSGFAMPNAGPGGPMRDAARGVTTEDDARAQVRDLAGRKPDLVKIWVDDRNETVEKLKPNLYRAIIDEAHKQNLRVMAHIAKLDDAKDLLRAGVDGFAHVFRDREADAELLAMIRQRPNVFFLETLWGERNAIYQGPPGWLGEPIVRETLPAAAIEQLRNGFLPAAAPATLQRALEEADRLVTNVAALHKAGAKLGLGTDTGGVSGGGYFGLATHVELELLVKAGLTPAQAIVAGTRTSAEILGLDRLGAIAPGKSADFLVLDANPLDAIGNTRKIARVVLRGVEVDRAALKARWSTTASR
jgi:imidazolonepropionase-like amidohydrolase